MSFKIIDLYRGTRISRLYKFYTALLNSSTNSSELLNIQKNRLVSQLKNLKTNNYYYAFLKKVNINDIENNPIKILNLLPLMDKLKVSENFEQIKNLNYKFENAYTGGSTGKPFHYLIDKKTISETRAFSYALWHHYLGYNLGDSILVIAGSSLGKGDSFKQKTYNYLQNKYFIPITNRGIGEAKLLAEKINKGKKPVFIYAYPSKLIYLISLIKQNNININKNNVKGIICTSEMLYDQQKVSISDFFETKVLNMYGANDGGIASGSIDNINFIYNGLACYAENVTIDGQQEIILTDLNSNAFPLIRYRVGDLGDIEYNSSGYPFIIKNLIGRSRDMIYIDKNKSIHGSEFNKIFKKFPNIIEYQIEQFSDYTCTIKLVCHQSNFMFKNESKLNTEIEKLLGNIHYEIQTVNKLSERENDKHKIIISHVN